MSQHRRLNVLDHGYVRLVDHMGSDLSVVRSARVSYDADWRTGEDEGKDEKLIRYLYKNGHTSPFESVVFTFEVQAPLFITRQWMRHRTQSYNEMSARYTLVPDMFYIPSTDVVGEQSKDSKQSRDLVSNPKSEEMVRNMCNGTRSMYNLYNSLLHRGMPRELARTVLPVSMYTRFFTTVNLHNLLKFIAERKHEHAQWEIQQYALAIEKLIKPIVPVTMDIANE